MTVRPLWSIALLWARSLARSKLAAFSMLLDPLLLGLLILLLAADVPDPHAQFRAAFGGGLMAFWTVVIFGSGQIFQELRQGGLLEAVVGAPLPVLGAVVGPVLVVNCLGVVAFAGILAVAGLGFGYPLALIAWWVAALVVAVCVLALTAMAVCVAAVFLVAREVYAWTNVLQVPLWLLSGLTAVPVDLPAPLEWLSRLLPTTWAMDAADQAARGGSALGPLGGCALVGVGYLLAAGPLLAWVQRRARVAATLSLT
jgi:ABC-2 type transport system permease protein